MNVKTGFIFLLVVLSTGCVSKKKHLEILQTLRTTNENVVNDWQKKYNTKRQELNAANEKINSLELDLAERKGENNILVGLRNELQLQIQDMESQMNHLGSSSQSVAQTLRSDVQKKEKIINALRQQLQSVNVVLDKNKEILQRVSGDLAYEMETMGQPSIEVSSRYNQVVLVIPEKILFKKGSTSRLTSLGKAVLEKVSRVLGNYPQMVFRVTGHTDTTPPNAKRYKDNWNFSALQAATIVRTLVTDYDMNTSQLTVAAKGESEPRTSNATQDGKIQNRRIEIIIYRPAEDMVKEVRQVVKGL